jgi:glutamyl-tRNA reductase
MGESQFQSNEDPTTQIVAEDDELVSGFVNGTDDLQRVKEASHQERQPEAARAEKMAREEGEFVTQSVALRELSPTIVAVGQRLEQIRSAQLERYRSKLGPLQPAQRRAVEALTRGILNRLLHGLVCELKAHAGAPEQQVQEQLVRRMFGLE